MQKCNGDRSGEPLRTCLRWRHSTLKYMVPDYILAELINRKGPLAQFLCWPRDLYTIFGEDYSTSSTLRGPNWIVFPGLHVNKPIPFNEPEILRDPTDWE